MKKAAWTVGMALLGFWFGWFGQEYPLKYGVLAILTMWGGCIGYGFGSIFDKRTPTKRLVIYWAITLALVGSVFFPFVPLRFPFAQIAVAAVAGALVGLLVGNLYLKLAGRKPQQPKAGITA
jgi:hypothetical protein